MQRTVNWSVEPQVEFFDVDSNILAKRIIILISGKANSGKSVFANYIAKELSDRGYTCHLESIAKNVKQCARHVFGWDGEKDKKGRKLLQGIGNLGREYDENLWVSYLVERTYVELPFVDFTIVDDWRFLNELEYLKEEQSNQVIAVRIISNREEIELSNDITETSLKDNDEYYDFRIKNTKDLENLEIEAKLFVGYILGG